MIDHEQGLLQAVLDAPDEDAPRLIYADWCQENGDPERAEFIRVQIELHLLPDCAGELEAPPCYVALANLPEHHWCQACRKRLSLSHRQQQVWELLWQLQPEWLNLLGERSHKINWCFASAPPPRKGIWACVRRGFIQSITCTCADWLANGPAIVKQQPVERVMLSDKDPDEATEGFGYCWYSDRTVRNKPDCDRIPDCLFRLLSGSQPGLAYYSDSVENAMFALSDACLLYARQTLLTV